MILILYTKLRKSDQHTINFFSEPDLNITGKKIVTLDVHSLGDTSAVLKMFNNEVTLNGYNLQDFDNVICLNIPRCDAICRLSDEIILPNLFRSQVNAFIDEISYLINESKWIPGTLNSILRGHSKLFVFKIAKKHGLQTPEITQYSQASVLDLSTSWYKKSLGFPCILSFDKTTKEERLINSTNRQFKENDLTDNLYWQWQNPIKAKSQIRCQIIGDKIWTTEWKKESTPYLDLRQVVSNGDMPDWCTTTLPDDIAQKTLNLMQDLKISVASPEFFITEDGEYIFFDLNPCGDIRGFYPPETTRDMVKEIYSLCTF